MRKAIIYLFFLFFVSCSLYGQEKYSIKSKKAISHFETAFKYFNNRQNEEAVKYLEKALEAEENFVEAYLLLATIFESYKQYDKVIEYYKTAIRINPDFSPKTYYNLGDIELMIGKYSDAKEHFEAFLKMDSKYNTLKEWTKKWITQCEFGIEAVSHPVPFDPKNIGITINTGFDEYWPSLTADEELLVFTRQIPLQKGYQGPVAEWQEDFYISIKTDSIHWDKAVNAGPPLNTMDNEGAQNISVDGRIMFFTGCNRKDSYGGCDIYFSQKIGRSWTIPVNAGAPVNSQWKETQPSIASDGKTLYFVSDRPGGKGKLDIWKTVFQGMDASGKPLWKDPVNLGDSINTAELESSPFIHPDNHSLYFSSDGHPGLGRFDFFISRKLNDTLWSKPLNLGYPINTHNEERGLIVNAKGNIALFSSAREEGKGLDIYQFEMYPEIRPFPVTYVKGTVYDAVTKEKLYARFELIDLQTAQTVIESFSNSGNGEFLVCLSSENEYALNVSKKGYLFFSEHFSLKNRDDFSKPYLMDIPLQPIALNEKIILKNIFYETDKYDLLPESTGELNKIAAFLEENRGLVVEISGHTDNVGTKEYNQTLSENRAHTVYKYLISQGIKKEQLSYKGYGFSSPIATNETPEGRAKNRRTEMKIIKIL